MSKKQPAAFDVAVGKLIREARVKRDLSQRALSRLMGGHPHPLSLLKYEHGTMRVPGLVIARLERALKLKPGALYLPAARGLLEAK